MHTPEAHAASRLFPLRCHEKHVSDVCLCVRMIQDVEMSMCRQTGPVASQVASSGIHHVGELRHTRDTHTSPARALYDIDYKAVVCRGTPLDLCERSCQQSSATPSRQIVCSMACVNMIYWMTKCSSTTHTHIVER